ncbi:MAG: D-alanyl-D-alanine carboxypeptidase family protein [Caldilineaceae bacterium]
MPLNLVSATAHTPKQKKKQRRWRLLLWLMGSISGGLLLCGFGPPQLIDRTVAPTQRVTAADVQQQVGNPNLEGLTAKAFLLYDVDADRTLFAKNSDQPLPPASLTKLMTSLLVLEKGNLADSVTIQAADLVGGSSMGLKAGETLTVEQLLWGLLIPSGNDAATALARHQEGAVNAFVQQMNARAAQLGLKQTHFTNPQGVDDNHLVASANDLLILTRQNWAFPLFRTIVATANTTVAGHDLQNTNELLGKTLNVKGVKTGTTDKAGECLIANLQHGKHQVITIVLDSRDRYSDTLTLDQVYQANYTWVDGDLQSMAMLNRLYAPDGTLWYLRATGAPPALLVQRKDTVALETYRLLQLPPAGEPWQSGMTVGVLEWRLGDQMVHTQPLVLW